MNKASKALPLLHTVELLKKGLPKTSFRTSLRDFMEWENVNNSKSYKFFNKTSVINSNEVGRLEPILSHCIARWMHFEYKLNYYPYSDLNVACIYTDLNSSKHMAENIVNYFKLCFPEDVFEAMNFYMVPLYDNTNDIKTKLAKGSKIKILNKGVLSNQLQNRIFHPVFVVMFNDIIRYLSCDLVKYDSKSKKWKQGYIDFESNQGFLKKSFEDMDYWCEVTTNLLKFPHGSEDCELFIPTRLVHLFSQLHRNIPEHRLFIIDESQRYMPSILTAAKYLMGWDTFPITQANISSTLYTGGDNFKVEERDNSTFITDFRQIRMLYTEITESTKVLESEDLTTFTNQWMDVVESQKLIVENDINLADVIRNNTEISKLGILKG